MSEQAMSADVFEAKTLPPTIASEEQLEQVLTQPSAELVTFIRQVPSPLLVLGAGGKMGPTLAVLARRAAMLAGHDLRVIAASRFSDAAARRWLEQRGIETVSCDMLNRQEMAKLPDAENVIYLVGLKFGTRENPALTWAANTLIPTNVTERFPKSKIVALSTGNVYPLVPVASGGPTESHPLTPVGEYANAAVARERLFEYHAQRQSTPLVLLRLNYAVELRYGVLHDIAHTIWNGKPVDVTSGYFNCLWQRDANDIIVRALAAASTPRAVYNMTGPEILSVRAVATRLAELMERPVQFTGAEANTALLNNSAEACARFGAPPTPIEQVIAWTAHWVKSGGASLNKPTRFEVRDGSY